MKTRDFSSHSVSHGGGRNLSRDRRGGDELVRNYTDKQFLKASAVFQPNILQEGAQISVDFDAVYNDGHGCAPQGSGLAKAIDKNTLKFTFTDSANNSGTGTIKREGDGVMISPKPARVADPRCVVFYQGSIRLKPACQRRQCGTGSTW